MKKVHVKTLLPILIKLRDEGRTWEEITEYITSQGYRTRKGVPHQGSQLCKALIAQHPKYRKRDKETRDWIAREVQDFKGNKFKDLVRYIVHDETKTNLSKVALLKHIVDSNL